MESVIPEDDFIVAYGNHVKIEHINMMLEIQDQNSDWRGLPTEIWVLIGSFIQALMIDDLKIDYINDPEARIIPCTKFRIYGSMGKGDHWLPKGYFKLILSIYVESPDLDEENSFEIIEANNLFFLGDIGKTDSLYVDTDYTDRRTVEFVYETTLIFSPRSFHRYRQIAQDIYDGFNYDFNTNNKYISSGTIRGSRYEGVVSYCSQNFTDMQLTPNDAGGWMIFHNFTIANNVMIDMGYDIDLPGSSEDEDDNGQEDEDDLYEQEDEEQED
jgi:hypothetical protein